MICGIFIVDSLKDKDTEGFERVARSHNAMDEGLQADLYLPPALRPSQCDIQKGSKVFAIADEATGYGCALYGIDCDVNFVNKNNYHFTKTLTVDDDITGNANMTIKQNIDSTAGSITAKLGNITAKVGDVTASTISLKTHVHQLVAIPAQDCALIIAGATSGQPAATLTATYTIIPS